MAQLFKFNVAKKAGISFKTMETAKYLFNQFPVVGAVFHLKQRPFGLFKDVHGFVRKPLDHFGRNRHFKVVRVELEFGRCFCIKGLCVFVHKRRRRFLQLNGSGTRLFRHQYGCCRLLFIFPILDLALNFHDNLASRIFIAAVAQALFDHVQQVADKIAGAA